MTSRYTLSVDSPKNLSPELSNALLRLIAHHSQVESTDKPTIEPTIKPTIKTTVDIHWYTIQADCNQFDDDANWYTIWADCKSLPSHKSKHL